MTTYVALLRGINVVGRNMVRMSDLQGLFVRLGYADARTYIQSGNVIFTSPSGDTSALAGAIEEAMATDLGVSPRVILRSQPELARVVAANPFLNQDVEPRNLHVAFLSGTPDPDRLDRIDPHFAAPDEFRVSGNDIYLHTPQGFGNTKLGNILTEKRIGAAATVRNWNTVTKLLQLAGSEPSGGGRRPAKLSAYVEGSRQPDAPAG